MRSTFRELELDRVAIQNITPIGTEQLVVTMKPGSQTTFQFEIKQEAKDTTDGTTTSQISIDKHGLTELFAWLRETGVLQ